MQMAVSTAGPDDEAVGAPQGYGVGFPPPDK